ncbi:MAG: SDR family oxidoreductase [Betaproteobacteria bacterium]|jgi:NAD(P)-dependent dehydrogenase (short-subunit alcohol dehydrogenase family)|nr:SDR family oxidoreductase [Betaproteobacteria bacterium]
MSGKLLEGDTALVTGAASGIGRGIAEALAHEGARVALTDIDAGRGEPIAAALQKEGCDARFIASDLSTAEGPATLLKRTLDALGSISVFVHSASPRRLESDNILAVSDETWHAMIAVNLHAGFSLARGAAREMISRKVKGRMLFLTSLHAETPRNLPHYSASKAGQTMLMKELARALGPHGIRVNAIAPGAIPGGGFDATGAGVERLTRCTSLGRLGTPQDVAGMAVALLADRFSAYVTGTTVVVDGGIALHNWIEPPAL